MEAKDLMVGDWVYDTILKGNTKVEILSLSGIRGDYHDNVWDEKTFEPVPLTAEILEKNGFVLINNFYRFSVQDVYDEVVVDVRISEEGCCRVDAEHCSDEIIEAEISAKIWNVHELQHALRLCGIDKEIVL